MHRHRLTLPPRPSLISDAILNWIPVPWVGRPGVVRRVTVMAPVFHVVARVDGKERFPVYAGTVIKGKNIEFAVNHPFSAYTGSIPFRFECVEGEDFEYAPESFDRAVNAGIISNVLNGAAEVTLVADTNIQDWGRHCSVRVYGGYADGAAALRVRLGHAGYMRSFFVGSPGVIEIPLWFNHAVFTPLDPGGLATYANYQYMISYAGSL